MMNRRNVLKAAGILPGLAALHGAAHASSIPLICAGYFQRTLGSFIHLLWAWHQCGVSRENDGSSWFSWSAYSLAIPS
jgi:hypothetical protein